MSDSNNNGSPTGTSPTGRRSSIAAQTLAELFGSGRNRPSVDNTNANAGSLASEVQRRRMSVSGQMSAFNGKRSDSIASTNSSYIDESAIEDGDAQNSGTSPFARRMSFGARALRDVRTGSSPAASAPTNGRSSLADTGAFAGDGARKTPPPSVKGRDSGYNWADSFRNRAERRSSIAGSSPPAFSHLKAKSIASSAPPPVKEVPHHNVPDHFQERILKGDFYMD